ncbi:restriction endonuclease subunit S [Halomonas sp. BC04]|uniref:restriction endonuclease subunit S n=1 Tax=Halomonas sp. BC04 TaxID=1403540 RepID=UPI0003ED648E|nr:restriction endonuclease subunit S [Halomonas sp. BC04]EWH00030.1 hypothetical protein Q427_21695 [Halomonas sp. BC04]
MSARELITDHLDLWTGAVTTKSTAGRANSSGMRGKIELTGIKKLRELILELAVRGKLVEQDPNDEPASVLLERITEEKARLVKEGKIKKPKKLPEITEEEKSFDTPDNWTWVRLCDLGHTQTGSTPSKSNPSFFGNEIPFIKPGDITEIGINYDNEGLTESGKIALGKWAEPGSILMVCIGTIGKCGVIDQQSCFNQQINSVTPFICQMSIFILICLKSPYFQGLAWEKSSSTTISILNKGKWGSIPLPLPPLEEQYRIVEKVDELMALCDRLEQQVGDQLEAHEVLVDTLLDALTRSANAAELAENWSRIAEHFDTLFTTEASIDKLKKTILQLAVMGRLVAQDAGDEPGGAVVSKMLQLRDHLASTNGMRTKASDSLSSNEQYLKTPSSWAWVRLGNMAKFIDYRGKTPTKTSNGKRLITAKNIRQGYIDLEPEEFISEGDYTKWMTRGFPRKGDMLFTPEAPLGNAAVIDLDEEFALAQRAICFQWHVPATSRFMLIQTMASPFQEKLVENATGMTATGIKASKLKEIPVAIPPLEEQHRIVEKVDELIALCDHLKARLSEASDTRTQLAEAVVEKAVS